MRNGVSTPSRPLTVVGPIGSASIGSERAAMVASLQTVIPGRPGQVLEPLGQVHGVADQRVLEAFLAAEQGRGHVAGRQADAEPERGQALGLPGLDSRLPGGGASPSAARTARSAWSAWGNGAPNTAMTASPTYCMTVPVLVEDGGVHLPAVGVELAGQHGRIGGLGDGAVAPHVGHEHGDLEPLGAPERRPGRRAASRPDRPGSRRLRVSPCSSRSTMAPVQQAQPPQRPLPARRTRPWPAARTATRWRR